MGWQTSAPSGITWGSWSDTGTKSNNYIDFWLHARIGRGAKNTIAVQVIFRAFRTDYDAYWASISGKAEISVAGGSWQSSSSYAVGPIDWRTEVDFKTIYYVGTAAKGATVKLRGYTPTEYTSSVAWSAPDYKTTYTISYNKNNDSATGTTASQTKKYLTAINLRSNGFSLTGYTFSKWNTKANGSGTNYNAGAAFNTDANTTLYAIWTPNTYTVTFKANGGTGADTTQTKTYGSDITLDPNTFTRDKFSFTGWNTKEDGTGTTYADEATYSGNEDLTLYAQWIKNNIPVFVNDNGTIRQVEKAYINDGGTIKECAVYINDNGTIKEIT